MTDITTLNNMLNLKCHSNHNHCKNIADKIILLSLNSETFNDNFLQLYLKFL